MNRWVAAMGGLLIILGEFWLLFADGEHKVFTIIFRFSRQRSADAISIHSHGTNVDFIFYLRTFVLIEIFRL